MRTALTALLLLAAAGLTGDETPIEVGGSATVKIQEQHIFPAPVFYAQPVGELHFGEIVDVTGEEGDWFSIETAAGGTGWVHATSLTGALLSEGSESTDDSDMIMLAGRGFNSDVEKAYAENGSLPWDLVDRIEDIEVDPGTIEAFLIEGMLIEGQLPEPADEPEQEPETEPQPSSQGGRA